jgi:hypothetical protein
MKLLVGKIRGLLDRAPELNDKEVNNSHKLVLEAFERLSIYIPDKYKYINLIDIVIIKSYGINTGLDVLLYHYLRLKSLINRIPAGVYFSKIVARFLVAFIGVGYNKRRVNSFDEISILMKSSTTKTSRYDKGATYNLFVANTQAYLLVMINYIERSSLKNNILVIPRSLKDVEIVKKSTNVNIIYFDDYCNDEIFKEYLQQKDNLKKVYLDNKDNIEIIFNLEGVKFFKYIENGVRSIFVKLLPESILYSLIVENICREIQVKNIIGARVRKIYDRSFYSFSRRNNIDSYVLLHSNLMRKLKLNNATGHFNNISGVFVWGESQKQTIENDIFSSVKKIHLTGSPLFEKLYDKEMGVSNRKKIIYACGENDLNYADLFVNASYQSSDSEIVIKVHPSVDAKSYIDLVKNKNIDIVSGESSFENLLDSTRIVVTVLSEAGLHSMFRNIPTIFILSEKKYSKLFDIMYDCSKEDKRFLMVENTMELKVKIQKILTSREYLKEYIAIQNRFMSSNFTKSDEKYGATSKIDRILC